MEEMRRLSCRARILIALELMKPHHHGFFLIPFGSRGVATRWDAPARIYKTKYGTWKCFKLDRLGSSTEYKRRDDAISWLAKQWKN